MKRAPRQPPLRTAALLALAVAAGLGPAHAADPFCESFHSDPLAAGRFVSLTAGTESHFRWDAATQRLEATLDVDASPAYYLSAEPLGPFTETANASFSATFQVQALDDRFSPTAALGLLTLQHVGDEGPGLVLVLSATNGTLVAAANIEPPGRAPTVGGDPIGLQYQRLYRGTGRYLADTRQWAVEVFDGPGLSNLVGYSVVTLPPGTTFALDRLGLQNAGARRGVDPDVGSLSLTLDELCTPADFPNLLTLSPPELRVAEGHTGSQLAHFTVTLSPASSQPISVRYRVSSDTARFGHDYTTPDNQPAGILEFAPGQSSRPLTLVVHGDTVHEDDEVIIIELFEPIGATLGRHQARLIIADDDPPPTVTLAGGSVFEGHSGTTNLTFTLTVRGASEKPASLRYRTEPGTATADVDYLSLTHSPTNSWEIPPARLATNTVLTHLVHVPLIGDRLDETVGTREFEDFFLVLYDPLHLDVLNPRAAGIIYDDDKDFLLWIDQDPRVFEGPAGTTTNLSFLVRLSRPLEDPQLQIRFGFSTVSGSATEQEDFLRTAHTLTFSHALTTLAVPVPVLGDDRYEPDESFEVFLRDVVAPVPVRLVPERSRARGWILNDDPPPQLRITELVRVPEGRSSDTTHAVFIVHLDPPSFVTNTIAYTTAPGTATPEKDYRSRSDTLIFLPGTNRHEILVPILGDDQDEPDEEDFYVRLTHLAGDAGLAVSQGRGVILDDDPLPRLTIAGTTVAEGHSGTREVFLPVTLDPPSDREIRVSYATEDGTAQAATGDYPQASGSLTFAPGETRHSLRLLVNGDRTFETDESFCVRLSHPVNAELQVPRACVLLTNDDPRPSLSFDALTVSVREGPSGATAHATFTLRLSNASQVPVSFQYRTRDGTARAPEDYLALPLTSFTFAPTETSTTLTVPVRGDDTDEGDEHFFLEVLNIVTAAPATLEARGLIQDDDFALLRVEDAPDVTEGHSGTTALARFRVTLTAPSTRDVSFDFTTTNGTALAQTDYVPVSGRRTIPAGATSTEITVPLRGDTLIEPSEVFSLDLLSQTGARGIQRSRGQGTILDDDTPIGDPPLTVSVVEGHTGTTTDVLITLSLDRDAPAEVRVRYQTANGTAFAGLDYLAASGELVIPEGQRSAQASFTVLGDLLPEPDETFTVRFFDPTNVFLRQSLVTVMILDDDPDPRLVDFRVLSGDCLPENGAIDPFETVQTSLVLTNASHLSMADVWVTLLQDPSVQPLLPNPVRFGAMPGGGNAVARTFAFQALGDCGQTVCARFEVRDGPRLLTTLSHCFQLGRLTPGGTWSCCDPIDLRLEATDTPDPVTVGSNLVFTVEVANLSPRAAAAVVVTNELPALLRFHQAGLSQGSLTNRGGVLLWTVGRLEPHATARLTLEVIAGQLADLTELPLTVTSYFSVGSTQTEQTPANNLAVVHTRLEPPRGLSVNSVAVLEGDEGAFASAPFKIWRGGTPAELASTVTVTVRTQDGTARAPDDYTAVSTNLTFGPNVTVRELRVPVRGDNLSEEDEFFHVVLSNPSVPLPLHSPGVGTILDDDLAFRVHDAQVLEGPLGQTSDLRFQVTLSQPATAEAQVEFRTADGPLAQAYRDYQPLTTNLVFPPNHTTRTVTVPVIGNSLFEPDKTFFARLANARFTHGIPIPIRRPEAIGTILNDDAQPLILSIADTQVREGGPGESPELRFPVRLSATPDQTVTVDYFTLDGTDDHPARAYEDYQPVTNRLEFPAGTTLLELPAVVRVHGDADPEHNETLRVFLTNALHATIAPSQAVATGTILNDDYLPRLIADGSTLSAENCRPPNQAVDPLETVTLDLFLKNIGLAPTTNLVATLLPTHSEGVRVLPSTTTAAYGRLPLQGRLSRPFELHVDGPCGAAFELVLQLQDQGMDAGQVRFPFRLGTTANGQPRCCRQADLATQTRTAPESLLDHPVTLTNVVSNLGPSRATGVQLTTTLPPGAVVADVLGASGPWTLVHGDLLCSLGDLEPLASTTLIVTLNPLPIGTHLFTAVVNQDSGVNDPVPTNNYDTTLTTVVPPTGLSISADPCAPEGSHALLTLRLHPPSRDPVSVRVSTASGTAQAGRDFLGLTNHLVTLGIWQTNHTLSLPLLGDDEDEPEEHFFVRLTNPLGTSLAVPEARVCILDTNLPCFHLSPTNSVNVGLQGEAEVCVAVWLSSPSDTNVTVSYRTVNGTATSPTDYTHQEGLLLFAPGVTHQQVCIRISGNTADEGEEHFFLELSSPVNATLCDQKAIIAITDLEPALLTVAHLQLPEGNPGHTNLARFHLRLDQPLPNTASVTVSTADGTDHPALAHQDYLPLDRTTVTFPPGVTNVVVEVPVLPDLNPEPDESFFLHLDRPFSNLRIVTPRATATLVNDDFPPTATLVFPPDQATFRLGTDLLIQVEARDHDPDASGQVVQVQLLLNDHPLALAHPPPAGPPPSALWTWLWTQPPLGEHVLRAIATDNTGITATSPPVSLRLVAGTNHPPFIQPSPLPPIEILEDGSRTVSFTFHDPDTPAEALRVTATSWNQPLLPDDGLTLDGTGTNRTLTLRPAPDQFSAGEFGSAWIFVTVRDDHQTVGTQFLATVLPVNDPPSFLPGLPVEVLEDSPPITLPAWATALSPGPANEQDQSLEFTVGAARPDLFAQPPTMDARGNLRFTPAPNAFGTNTVTVILRDSGGTARGGVDAVTNHFTLALLPVNDPPTLDPIPDRFHRVNTAVQTVPLTGITTGAPNEIQSLTVTAASDNPALLEPTINYSSPAATGTLTYQPKPDQTGVATVTVTVGDSGGVERGGQDQIQRSFRVTVLPNQLPTVRLTAPMDGQVFSAPATVLLQAIATDPDGQVVQVEFLANGRVIGQDTTDPYQFTWTGVPADDYKLVARATDNDGAFTNSLPVSITVREGLALTLTSPAPNAAFCPGAPIAFAATVHGDLPPGSVVEFHTDDGLLETAATAPFAVLRRQGLPTGSFRVHARLLDAARQERARSFIHPFEVLPVCGDVAIIRNYHDPQITHMVEQLQTERLLPFVRNGVDVFPQPGEHTVGEEEATFERLLGYKLIIWAGLARPGEGLTDTDVEMLWRLRDAGKSLYLISPQVLDDTGRLSPDGAARYAALANLLPLDPSEPAGLAQAHPSGYGDPIFQTTPGGFVIPPPTFNLGDHQRAQLIVTNGFQVKVTVEGDPVMIVTPPVCDLDQGQARLATQSVALESSIASQNLFKNTALWLMRGWYCENLELLLGVAEGPPTGRVGEVLTYAFTIEHSGACGAAGVTLVEELPEGWQVHDVEIANGSWEQVGPWLHVNLGCLDQAVTLLVRLHLLPTQPGAFVHVVRVRAEAELFNIEKHEVRIPTVIEGADLAPRLEWQRSAQAAPSTSTLWLHGAPDIAYDIEQSTDLLHWQKLQTVNGPAAQIPLDLESSPRQKARFFRAVWPLPIHPTLHQP